MKARKRRDFLKNIAIVGTSASLYPHLSFSETSQVNPKKEKLRMRIPITMCHGIDGHSPVVKGKKQAPLSMERYRNYFRIASEMGFKSISYDQLEAWNREEVELERPIMFDFDHPNKAIRHEIQPVMKERGYKGNLFIQTVVMEEMYAGKMPEFDKRQWMTWDEIGGLMDDGWTIGSHTHTHASLNVLSAEEIRAEMILNDTILKRELGLVSKDFAFVGTTWSELAEREAMKRYRFGRLWTTFAGYSTGKGTVRYADLVGIPGEDEKDGGPPYAARYITNESHPYKLPSMEFEYLIYKYDAFKRYLEGALAI